VGGLLRLFADVLHTFRDIARNALIQGGLFVPWRPRLRVSSTDTFGEPEQHTGRWIGCRIRFCGWVLLLCQGGAGGMPRNSFVRDWMLFRVSARQNAMPLRNRALLHSGARAVPRGNLPKGVHRVRRKVVSGVRYHFYAWRGGPKFWEGTNRNPKAPEFFHAFSQCGTPVSPAEYLTTHLVDDFLSSASLPKVERSKADIRKWLELFREEFGADPVALFEERASRG
jgi:hypothetical protein